MLGGTCYGFSNPSVVYQKLPKNQIHYPIGKSETIMEKPSEDSSLISDGDDSSIIGKSNSDCSDIHEDEVQCSDIDEAVVQCSDIDEDNDR